MRENDNFTAALDFAKFQNMAYSFNAIKKMVKGQNVDVSYKLYEPFRTTASVTIEGTGFTITNPELFVKICKLASNVEFYPLVDNKARFTLTFNGITNPIKEEI